MTDDRITALFFELFGGLPRQGPGDDASTVRALSMVPNVSAETRVLDLGCGTGAHTRVLAKHSPARIVAIDNHPPFIDELKREAERVCVADRIDARVGDMKHLDVERGAFDLIWSEGSIFVVGFEEGLREWRAFLAPGGHVALTEACWIKPNPPRACAEFWEQEYPAIRDVPTRLATITTCGYDIAGHFTLPSSSWWDEYYRPLQQNIDAFRTRYPADPEAQGLADQVQREIDMWQAYAAFYSYEFFVMRGR
jgi:SAM-dependent methyltransferase